jgi:hypothetical protein
MAADGHDLPELLETWSRYRCRYRVAVPPELERLELARTRRAVRVEVLRDRVAETLAEIARVEAELVGIDKGYAALLADTIDRLRHHHQEGWTPDPVMGYRLWGWREGSVHGAWERWTEPRNVASCRTGQGEVPHSDGRCGRLGCGIYATKELAPLLRNHTAPSDHGYLTGLVAMTGKVVEHERGYRAERAEVVAAVLVDRGRVVTTDDRDELAELFAWPDGTMTQLGRQTSRSAWDEILSFLAADEGNTRWISESRSA